MVETLFGKDPDLLIPIIALIAGGLVALIAVGGKYWKNVRQLEIEAALKQDMLARGMSADDIEKVLRATAVTKECHAPEHSLNRS